MVPARTPSKRVIKRKSSGDPTIGGNAKKVKIEKNSNASDDANATNGQQQPQSQSQPQPRPQSHRHQRTNKNHMYNIPVERWLLDGTCSGCIGGRDKKAKAANEPVLLCDGKGCVREYHLNCISHIEPPLKEVPEGQFFCVDCDPSGKASALESYFEKVEKDRARYETSKAFVEYTIHKSLIITDDDDPSDDEEDYSVDKTKWSATDINWEEIYDNNGKKQTVPSSELLRVVKLHAAAMDNTEFGKAHRHLDSLKVNEVKENESTKAKGTKPKDDVSDNNGNSNEKNGNSSSNSSSSSSSDAAYEINTDDAELLVGNTIKLWCAKDDKYHTGRILDWRNAVPPGTNPKDVPNMFYGAHAGSIVTSEYLTYFAAGHEGRKKAVYQWIILEEHSCAIGLSIVMALQDKGRGLNGYKPAQILYRTCLELIPVQELLVREDDLNQKKLEKGQSTLWGFAYFFGSVQHTYIDLVYNAVDYYSEYFRVLREKKTFFSEMYSENSKKPKNYESHIAITGVTLAAAHAEMEERRRVCRWHTLPLQNRYHDKALTIINEHSFDLLLEGVDDINGDGKCVDSCATDMNNVNEEEEKKESHTQDAIAATTTTGSGSGCNNNSHDLRLCPLIPQGLDKYWIASRLSKVSNEYSFDSMASMKARVLRQPLCITMAHYNEKFSRKK